MKTHELVIGTRMELEMISSLGTKVGGTYISQLLEFSTDGRLIISAPISESRIVFVPVSARLRLTFLHSRYGLLGFEGVVRSRDYRGNIAVLHVEQASEIEKIQRREHYRLDCHLNALFKVSDDNNAEPGEEVQLQKAITKNISGSGACIVTEADLAKNTLINLSLELNNTVRVKARCTVLRNVPVEIRKSRHFELGVRFAEISQRDQDNIIKFIFEQQRMLLKKEAL